MDAMEIRRNAIVELVNKYGTVSFSQIKEQFSNVSEMTLRTDLKALDEAKEIVRIHGGAKSVQLVIGTDDYLTRRAVRNIQAKQEIARKALKLIQPDTAIFMDSGSTTTELAKIFPDQSNLILACGASNPRDINVPGREAKGIYFAVDFLKKTTKSLLDSNFEDGNFISAKGKNVLVIGGGDTGNDCVGTSIRLGAQNVIQLEMMPKAPDQRAESNPWPEWPKICKTDYGQEEAIALYGHDPRIYETTVKSFIANDNGEVCAAELVKLSWQKDPESGRMVMHEIEGSNEIIPVDLVLIAAGFLGSQSYVTDAFGVEVDGRTNVKTEPGHYHTSEEKVYVAGDMHRGQSLVVWAIREGREAAKCVDINLMGYTNLD